MHKKQKCLNPFGSQAISQIFGTEGFEKTMETVDTQSIPRFNDPAYPRFYPQIIF